MDAGNLLAWWTEPHTRGIQPGAEKTVRQAFEAKNCGVCNAFLRITSRSTRNLALEKRFFNLGAECLYSRMSMIRRSGDWSPALVTRTVPYCVSISLPNE